MHAALLGARRYTEAIDAYNDMLLMLEQSVDPVTRGKYSSILYESVVSMSASRRIAQKLRNHIADEGSYSQRCQAHTAGRSAGRH